MESGKDITRAAGILRAGGLVITPTETSYGLAASALQVPALQRLFAVKHRKPNEPVGVFLPNMEAVHHHFLLGKEEEALAERFWPGALNILLTPRPEGPLAGAMNALAPGKAKLSVRLSSRPEARELVEVFGGPITSTSANRSGEGDVYDASRFAGIFSKDDIDYVIDAGVLPQEKPSTVVEWTPEGLRVLRQGNVIVS